jgi:hypothetical protein
LLYLSHNVCSSDSSSCSLLAMRIKEEDGGQYMSRPADAEGKVAEKLREYWERLVQYEKDFAKGDNETFYELVGKCVDQLWEQYHESTWQTQWKEVVVWKRVELKPGEAERRIREHVRPWLAQARKLSYKRWWVTDGVESMGDYVERWFGAEGGAAKQTEAQSSAEKMRNMLAELRALCEKYG